MEGLEFLLTDGTNHMNAGQLYMIRLTNNENRPMISFLFFSLSVENINDNEHNSDKCGPKYRYDSYYLYITAYVKT